MAYLYGESFKVGAQTPAHNNFDMVHGKPNYLGLSDEFCRHQYPEGSSCMETELECSAVNLKSVPLVSSNITLLSLVHNQIHSLPDEVYSMYTKVKKIFLQHNIQAVSRKAFFGLYRPQKLLMINNSLETLPKKICTQMPLLLFMDFDGKHIKALTSPTFLEYDVLMELVSASVIFELGISKFEDFQMTPPNPVQQLLPNPQANRNVEPNLYSLWPNTTFLQAYDNETMEENETEVVGRKGREERKPNTICFESCFFTGVNLLASAIIIVFSVSMLYSVQKTALQTQEVRSPVCRDVAVVNQYISDY
ncbi:LOW QUALITY PROTEIN: relaxin receptor 2 [Amazona ochrocephala]